MNYRQFPPKKPVAYRKFFLLALVIIAPLILIMLIFTPIACKKSADDRKRLYTLEENYSKQDVVQFVDHMRTDPEFQFYYAALSTNQIEHATGDVWRILNENRTAASLKQQMELLKKEVGAVSLLFYHLDFSDEFYIDPHDFPDLHEILWKFLFLEYKYTILGVVYHVNYDNNFFFQWNKQHRLAAKKLYDTIVEINKFKKR